MLRTGGFVCGAIAGATLASARPYLRPEPPDVRYGRLFADVQRAGVFPDQKTFPDCVPLEPVAVIRADYERERGAPNFDLRRFVARHFRIPAEPTVHVTPGLPLGEHIASLWSALTRPPVISSTGIALAANAAGPTRSPVCSRCSSGWRRRRRPRRRRAQSGAGFSGRGAS